jgi:hypothetical protein
MNETLLTVLELVSDPWRLLEWGNYPFPRNPNYPTLVYANEQASLITVTQVSLSLALICVAIAVAVYVFNQIVPASSHASSHASSPRKLS